MCKHPIFVLLVLMYSASFLEAQTMQIKEYLDVSNYSVQNVKKISFTSGQLCVSNANNVVDSFFLKELHYLKFKEFASDSICSFPFSIYPNPVEKFLYINILVTKNGIMRLMSLEGKVLALIPIYGCGIYTVNFNRFKQGLYLLRFEYDGRVYVRKIIKG